ncbi:hypothetical protein QEN19_003193 [Hanseniaspora menglaensis]
MIRYRESRQENRDISTIKPSIIFKSNFDQKTKNPKLLAFKSTDIASSTHNGNNNNFNYLLYEMPEEHSRHSSTSTMILPSSRQSSNNNSDQRIKIVIKDCKDSSPDDGIFKSNYQINFNSSKQNKNSYQHNKKAHLFSSNSSNSLNAKSRNGSKQSMSPSSQYGIRPKAAIGEPYIKHESDSLSSETANGFDDQSTLKTDTSFLDLISSLNEDKILNESNYKSNISKQLRINQKMSHLKKNIEKKDKFYDENERYFYSEIKFINDEINQQFRNLKKQTLSDISRGTRDHFIIKKYNDSVMNANYSNQILDENNFKDDDSLITSDVLINLSQKIWKQAETL